MFVNSIVIDIITVAIIILSALAGRKRGLIKTLSGIVALILSFSIAGFLANATTDKVSDEIVKPHVESFLNSQIDSTIERTPESDTSVVSDILANLGLPPEVIENALHESISAPISSATDFLAQKITYALLFCIYFILSLIITTLLLKLVNLAAKFPGLNFVNKLAGLIFGILWGYLIVMALSFILLQFRIFLTDELVSQTFVLKFISNFSIASLF